MKKFRLPSFLVLAPLFISSILLVHTIFQKNATYDEHLWLDAGKHVRSTLTWDRKNTLYHPPLSFYIQGAFAPIRHLLGQKFNIRWARIPFVPIFFLLGIYIYIWSYELKDKKAGIVSLLFFSFSPNVLAHAGLITTDFLLSACGFISTYYFWKTLKKNTYFYSVLCGLFLGLSFLSKYSSVFIVFSFFFIAFFSPLPVLKTIRSLFLILITAIVVLNAGYFFGTSDNISGYSYHWSIFNVKIADFFLSVLPKPFVVGIDLQKYLSDKGHPVFFFGKRSIYGWWYYYFGVLAVKLTIPSILFILFLPFYCIKQRENYSSVTFFSLLFLPLFLLFYFSFCTNNYSGLRFILPIFPFVFVLFGQMASYFLDSGGKIATGVITCCIFWQIFCAVSTHPHYLAYFNEFIGGKKNGYKYLSGSNSDWGQDMEEAKRFYEKNKATVKVDPPCRPQKGKFLVNVNDLQDTFRKNGCHEWMRYFEPEQSISFTWFIYNITTARIKELYKTEKKDKIDYFLASATLGDGKIAEAKNYILQAIKEDGQNFLYYNLLGEIFMAQGDYDTARKNFTQSLKYNYNNPSAFKNLSTLLYQKKEYKRSAAYYKKALVLDLKGEYVHSPPINSLYYKGLIENFPNQTKYKNNYAISLWVEGYPRQAIVVLEEILKEDPYFVEAYVNLASLYVMGGLGWKVGGLMEKYEPVQQHINSKTAAVISYGKDRILMDDILVIFPPTDERIIKMKDLVKSAGILN